MATGLSGYNISPLNYVGKDGILFHLQNDMSVFLKLTATTDMAFSAPMSVTTQPVQTGQTVTDNMQEQPQTIQINGVVVVGYEGTFFTTKNITVVEDFITTLQRWRQQRQVMRVLCQDGITLNNALCTVFEAKKDSRIANGLNISLTFQDANFVAQLGKTQGVANGTKTAKTKTKHGAVTGKKDVGKSGSQTTKPRTPCQIVKARESAGDTTAWIPKASGACDFGGYQSSGTIYYNESNASKYIPKNVYGAMGGNVTKQSK